jgi:hypothetical protein
MKEKMPNGGLFSLSLKIRALGKETFKKKVS